MKARFLLIGALLLSFIPIFFLVGKLYPARNDIPTPEESILPKQKEETSPIPIVPKTETPLIQNFSKVSLLHFGDAMFDRGVRTYMKNGSEPFSDLKRLSISGDYDVRMLNLEGPIITTPRERCQQKPYSFQFASNTPTLLADAGFTLVSLGNNHSLDCFRTGLDTTVSVLKDANIAIAGYPSTELAASRSISKEGTKMSVIGYDATLKALSSTEIMKVVHKEVAENNIVVFSVHWGEEYEPVGNDKQTTFAHELIDAGVTAVIGSHPHVVQNLELYKGKLIFYSLGNFIFDQKGEKENAGVGVGIAFFSDHTETMLYPYVINSGVPTFLSMKDANAWCSHYYGSHPFVEINGCAGSFPGK